MKRKMALLLTGVMIAATLFGCGGGSSDSASSDTAEKTEDTADAADDAADDSADEEKTESSEGGVTLTLYCNADDLAKPYMQKIISMWEEATGNKIDQQGLDTDNAETIALTKFTTGDIPDLYVHFGNSNLKNFNPCLL